MEIHKFVLFSFAVTLNLNRMFPWLAIFFGLILENGVVCLVQKMGWDVWNVSSGLKKYKQGDDHFQMKRVIEYPELEGAHTNCQVQLLTMPEQCKPVSIKEDRYQREGPACSCTAKWVLAVIQCREILCSTVQSSHFSNLNVTSYCRCKDWSGITRQPDV